MKIVTKIKEIFGKTGDALSSYVGQDRNAPFRWLLITLTLLIMSLPTLQNLIILLMSVWFLYEVVLFGRWRWTSRKLLP